MNDYIKNNIEKWIEDYKIKEEDKDIFISLCELAIKDDKERPNINTFHVFKKLSQNIGLKYNYIIADEIIANRTAIMSLDKHVADLIDKVILLSVLIQKNMKDKKHG